MTPTAMPAMHSAMTDLRTVHGSPCSESSDSGLKRSRWVFSENHRPAT